MNEPSPPAATPFHPSRARAPSARCPRLRLPASVGLVLLALSAAAGCSRQAQATSDADPRDAFPIVLPSVRDAVHARPYVAEIRAARRVEIRSRIAGYLENVAVDEGQQVEAGQLLFAVNATELRQQERIAHAAASSAAAELERARLEREGTRLLFDKDVVSQAELALADAEVQELEAKLEQARAIEGRAKIQLGYARVRAPFAGVVNRIPLKLGSAVGEGEPLTTLTDASEIYAYFRVSESEYLEHTALTAAAPEQVWLELADGSTYPSAGVVDAVESEFDSETGTIAFRARFPNAEGRLKHGSTGRVILKTDLRQALLVPQKATFEVQDQLFVYVVGEDGTARARRIVPKLRLDGKFVVDSGLEPTDRIVLEGVQRVREGLRVKALAGDAPQERT